MNTLLRKVKQFRQMIDIVAETRLDKIRIERGLSIEEFVSRAEARTNVMSGDTDYYIDETLVLSIKFFQEGNTIGMKVLDMFGMPEKANMVFIDESRKIVDGHIEELVEAKGYTPLEIKHWSDTPT